MQNDNTLNMILCVASDMNPTFATPIDVAKGREASLFGPDGPLDSMALVQFIVEVESALEDTSGKEVVLADERAMSQRRSPFQTIGSLAQYIDQLLADQKAAS